MHQVVWERAMKRHEIILRVLNGQLNWIQASEILGISARQMGRIKWKYERYGFKAFEDGRYGRAPWNRVSVEQVKLILKLYRENYFDFNTKHFHEKLSDEHHIVQSYSWVKNILQEAGLVAKEKKKGKHRRKRERRPLVGMMLHLDGSSHHWLGDNKPKWDLLVIFDDANSESYDGIFVPEEDTRSVMQMVRSVVDNKGVFCSLYTDRASHFVFTPKAGGKPDKSIRTQCQRVLDQLGIRLIPAFSPQARGRGERLWKTIQGRLPQELRLAGVETIEQANRYLKEVFIPDLNKRFCVEPKEKGSAFVPVLEGLDLNRVFSLQYERVVKNDNTVAFKNMTLQIPESAVRFNFARCTMTVYEHLDKTISTGYGPHIIGRYSPQGELGKTAEKQNLGRRLEGAETPGRPGRAQGFRPQSPCVPDVTMPLPVPRSLLASERTKPGGKPYAPSNI
jgi:transposase